MRFIGIQFIPRGNTLKLWSPKITLISELRWVDTPTCKGLKLGWKKFVMLKLLCSLRVRDPTPDRKELVFRIEVWGIGWRYLLAALSEILYMQLRLFSVFPYRVHTSSPLSFHWLPMHMLLGSHFKDFQVLNFSLHKGCCLPPEWPDA